MKFLGIALMLVALSISRPALADGTAGPPDSLRDRFVKDYFDGKWDDLSAELIANAKAIAALPPEEKADVDYIRRTLFECHPAWWKLCKAGEKLRFRPIVWGHTLVATFIPGEKTNINVNYVNGAASVELTWNAKAMDDPAVEGELEFTKGENAMLSIWSQLGTSESWTSIPPHFQLNMKEDAKVGLMRYLDFRGHVTAAYYATPRARRLAIWQSISGWSHEYDKASTAMAIKSVGVLLAAEYFSHPESYPTLKLPEEPPAEGAESKMIWSLQEQIRFHPLTFAEDRTLRDAIKTFAMANASEPKIRTTGKVILPNGLFFSLDPVADKPLSQDRDAWIKTRYAKAGKVAPRAK